MQLLLLSAKSWAKLFISILNMQYLLTLCLSTYLNISYTQKWMFVVSCLESTVLYMKEFTILLTKKNDRVQDWNYFKIFPNKCEISFSQGLFLPFYHMICEQILYFCNKLEKSTLCIICEIFRRNFQKRRKRKFSF